MPKIIKDIQPHILDVAMQLIDEMGYEKVNMRNIAQRSDIAVGTLYNYYKNKDILLLKALTKSWTSTLVTIKSEIDQLDDLDKKIELFITILYDSMAARKGLGRILLFDTRKILDSEPIETMTTIMANVQKELLILLETKKVMYGSRKVITIVPSIAEMITKFSNERKINIEYILSSL